MFTGLVQSKGLVVRSGGGRLSVVARFEEPLATGESLAVNGVCLTVTPGSPADEPMFDLSEETLARTTLGGLRAGDPVNLERALRLGDRLGGHMVQGHVDAVGEVVEIEAHEESWRMRFRVPEGRYLIDKGSIALDGISLTVVAPEGPEFDVWVIPHTWQETNLGIRRPGDRVNVEYDVLAKHVERLLAARLG